MDYYPSYTDSLYLEHHGVKGQKWGVRRYQNKDGSLTDAGKKHIGIKEKVGNKLNQAKEKLKNAGKVYADYSHERAKQLGKVDWSDNLNYRVQNWDWHTPTHEVAHNIATNRGLDYIYKKHGDAGFWGCALTDIAFETAVTMGVNALMKPASDYYEKHKIDDDD